MVARAASTCAPLLPAGTGTHATSPVSEGPPMSTTTGTAIVVALARRTDAHWRARCTGAVVVTGTAADGPRPTASDGVPTTKTDMARTAASTAAILATFRRAKMSGSPQPVPLNGPGR